VFVAFNQAGDVLQELGWHLVFTKHSRSNRCGDRRLEMCCRVSFPNVSRGVLMESMNELVELERIDFATIPTIELYAKLTKGFTQVAIVSNHRPFSDHTLDVFRNCPHRLRLADVANEPHVQARESGAAPRRLLSVSGGDLTPDPLR
jgi:hypothetical protein